MTHRFTKEEVILGGERGGAALRNRSHQFREEREREIVRIVRRTGFPKTVEVYCGYVKVCAERGWPLISYRRFSWYVSVLEQRGRLQRTVIVGHGGSLSVLRVADTTIETRGL